MLSFHLRYLSTRKIKYFFTQEFKNHHIILTETFTGPTRSNNITDKSWPVFWPFLFQYLKWEKKKKDFTSLVNDNTSYWKEQIFDHFAFSDPLLKQEMYHPQRNTMDGKYNTNEVLSQLPHDPLNYCNWSNLALVCIHISICQINMCRSTLETKQGKTFWLASNPWKYNMVWTYKFERRH